MLARGNRGGVDPNACRVRPGSDRGENVFTSAGGRASGRVGGGTGRFASMCVVPYLSASQNEAPATSDIVTRDMSIDQWARDFNDSLNSFY